MITAAGCSSSLAALSPTVRGWGNRLSGSPVPPPLSVPLPPPEGQLHWLEPGDVSSAASEASHGWVGNPVESIAGTEG